MRTACKVDPMPHEVIEQAKFLSDRAAFYGKNSEYGPPGEIAVLNRGYQVGFDCVARQALEDALAAAGGEGTSIVRADSSIALRLAQCTAGIGTNYFYGNSVIQDLKDPWIFARRFLDQVRIEPNDDGKTINVYAGIDPDFYSDTRRLEVDSDSPLLKVVEAAKLPCKLLFDLVCKAGDSLSTEQKVEVENGIARIKSTIDMTDLSGKVQIFIRGTQRFDALAGALKRYIPPEGVQVTISLEEHYLESRPDFCLPQK